jgi:iron uptake system EfeUOB component EfeO/EfeM
LAPTVGLAAGAALVAFLALTALGVGDGTRRAKDPSPTFTPLATYSARAPHVKSEYQIYSVRGAAGGSTATPPPELPPTRVSAFTRPVALYRTYAVAQLGLMEAQIARLQEALAANDREAAKQAWRSAYTSYLRLGAVYLVGQLAALDAEINVNAGGLPGGTASPRFVGLHRIEYGLWSGEQPSALVGSARQLDAAVHRLRSVLPHVSIEPLEYATRAHEILEDAARDLLSGADVPWSGEGVLATAAGLEATEEVISTLRPVLTEVEGVIPTVDTELGALRSALASIAAAHGGRPPTKAALTQQQSELLNGRLGGALEALSQVPGVLETELPPHTPQLPPSAERIDP